ncbi:ribonuclease H-like domain-containing protein [Tanacetum coccineum]
MTGPVNENITNNLLAKLLQQLDTLEINNNTSTRHVAYHAGLFSSTDLNVGPIPTGFSQPAYPSNPYATFGPNNPIHPTYPPAYYLPQVQPTPIGSLAPTVAQQFGTPPQPATLPDPTHGAWNIDTVASSHINNSVHSLSEIFNTCMYSSILVGDGHSIPVTNTGHSILPTPLKSLHLNNVLITPHVVKILILVREFVRDNNCTIEFDAFGFSVKDFMTRRVLLICDSTGDLYPITDPYPILHVFLVSQHTWHQRLGHPGRELFCHKYLEDGTLSRYKARLVANGSTQIEGVDVDETFSSVVKLGTIRTILSLATSRHWPIHQLDVKNAFLHGDLSETVYMHQPPGFRDSAHPNYVCLLQRSLYGLKQAPRAWFQDFASYITRAGFSHSRCDSSLFIYRQRIDTAYLLLYVDDIVLTASSESLLQRIIGLFLSQKKYVVEILEKAHMVNCNPSRTPVDTESKLGVDGDPVSDLTFSVDLVTYSNADWAGCPTTWRSTSGYCVFLGNNLLSWSSKRQPTLSRSSAKAEYRGVANVVAETYWLRNLLRELHTPLSSATLVYCDNVSVVYLSCNPVQHQRTKHIEIDIHFVRDLVAAGQVRVIHVPSRYQFADIFTKGLSSALFEEFRSSLSVRCRPAHTAGEC